ncbi:MAG: GH3 family domain-containing protein [Candidatus Thorarchaeota archaeon]
MSILSRLVSLVVKRRAKQIELVLENELELMEEKLASILKRHEGTYFGRRHGFGTISSSAAYSDKVPLMDYTSLEPYLEMVYQDPNAGVLTADPVIWYLRSSGTTGHPKKLPITEASCKDLAAGSSLSWMGYMNADPENVKVVDGTLITFGAPAVIDHIGDIPVGYGTGVLTQRQNKLFQRLIKPGPEVYNIMNIEDKMKEYARLMVTADVTGLGGITTLSLAQVRRMQQDYGPWLLDEMRGTKHERRIRDALDDNGQLDVAALWPDLRLFFAVGIDTDPYREWISKTFPGITVWETYGGSEGFYAGQLLPEPGVQLATYLNYFEFIPESQVNEVEPEVIPLVEVKKGNRYEIVVTNIGGYYRYRIGDMVTVTNTDPYTVRHIGRKGSVVNLAGEKLSDSHVANAMKKACEQTGVEVIDYSLVGRVKDGIPQYVLATMFRNENTDAVDFITRFEDAIMDSNYEFRHSREMGALGPTVIRLMKTSYFDSLVQQSPHGQVKPVHLSTNEELLAGTMSA